MVGSVDGGKVVIEAILDPGYLTDVNSKVEVSNMGV